MRNEYISTYVHLKVGNGDIRRLTLLKLLLLILVASMTPAGNQAYTAPSPATTEQLQTARALGEGFSAPLQAYFLRTHLLNFQFSHAKGGNGIIYINFKKKKLEIIKQNLQVKVTRLGNQFCFGLFNTRKLPF